MGELFRRYLLETGVSDTHVIMFAFDMDEDIDLLDDYYPDEETRIKTNTPEFYKKLGYETEFVRMDKEPKLSKYF